MPPSNDIIDLTTPEPEARPIPATVPRPAPASSVPSVSPALRRAVEDATSERLRQTIFTLAKDVPGVSARLDALLLFGGSAGSGSRSSAGEPNRPNAASTTRPAASAVKVQARSRWVTCANCEKEFDAANNSDDEACVYHSGELEVDWANDFWADTDEDVHGPIDTDENKDEFPEGFVWSCCDTNGAGTYEHDDLASNPNSDGEDDEDREMRLGEGCEFGRHVALDGNGDRHKRKKRRRGY